MNQELAKALGVNDYLIKSHHTPDEVVAKVNPPVAEEVVEEAITPQGEPLPAELGGEEAGADAVPES